jgi:hypothetical protein
MVFGERSIRQEIGRSSEKRGSKMLLRAEQSCKARPFVLRICLGHFTCAEEIESPVRTRIRRAAVRRTAN